MLSLTTPPVVEAARFKERAEASGRVEPLSRALHGAVNGRIAHVRSHISGHHLVTAQHEQRVSEATHRLLQYALGLAMNAPRAPRLLPVRERDSHAEAAFVGELSRQVLLGERATRSQRAVSGSRLLQAGQLVLVRRGIEQGRRNGWRGEAGDLSREIEAIDRMCLMGRLAAELHDTGKLFIAPALLDPKRQLLPSEFDQIKLHSVLGAQQLLGDLYLLGVAHTDADKHWLANLQALALTTSLTHHNGYNQRDNGNGLKFRQLPPFTQLTVAVTTTLDALDAMLNRPMNFRASNGSKRDARMKPVEALQELREGDKHFHPAIVDLLADPIVWQDVVHVLTAALPHTLMPAANGSSTRSSR